MVKIKSFLGKNKWAILLSLVFCLFFVPIYGFTRGSGPHDDASYVSHAFTLGLDFDTDYSNEIALYFNRDKNIPIGGIGTGILAAPFVALFGIIDRITDNPVILDRSLYVGSWSYFGFLFSASFYYLLGVYCYYKSLNRIFSSYNFAINFLVTLSTGVIYYVLMRFTMSHAFEFFMLACTFWSAVNLYFGIQNKNNILLWMNITGIASIANLWIRPANYNALFIPYIVLLLLSTYYEQIIEKKKYLLLTLFVAVYLLPYFIFNLHYFHSALPSMNEAYSTTSGIPQSLWGRIILLLSLSPHILLLLFSSEFGLLYTNPVLLLGFAGLAWFLFIPNKTNGFRRVFGTLLILIYFGFSVAIVLLWQTNASDYGYRYLFVLLPISMFGFAFLYQNSRSSALKGVFIILFAVGILSVFFYNKTPLLSPHTQVNVYGVQADWSARGYNLDLIKELTNPQTYMKAAAKSYLGFLGYRTIVKSKTVKLLIPDELLKKYVQVNKNLPQSIYTQTYAIFFLWLSCGIFADKYLFSGENI